MRQSDSDGRGRLLESRCARVTTRSRDPESRRKNVLEDSKGPVAGMSLESLRIRHMEGLASKRAAPPNILGKTPVHPSKPQPGQL